MKIKQIKLGGQGLAVPMIGLGCMGMTGFEEGHMYGPADEQEAIVTFGSVSARLNSSALEVNWQTLSEKNVDHFEVMVSADGKNFTSAGQLLSKAPNGNSSEKLEYSFTISSADLSGKIGLASNKRFIDL